MSHKFNFKRFRYSIEENELLEHIDDIKPITLKYNKDLVNRVHNRYPFISKYKVALIIRTSFYLMRGLLFRNKILYFGNFIPTLYMIMSKRFTKHQGNYALLKIKASTPKKIKKVRDVRNERFTG